MRGSPSLGEEEEEVGVGDAADGEREKREEKDMSNPNVFFKDSSKSNFLFLLFSLFENEIWRFSSTVCPRMPICPPWFSRSRPRNAHALVPSDEGKGPLPPPLDSLPNTHTDRPTERPTRFGYPTHGYYSINRGALHS